jgi:hypothetical protein
VGGQSGRISLGEFFVGFQHIVVQIPPSGKRNTWAVPNIVRCLGLPVMYHVRRQLSSEGRYNEMAKAESRDDKLLRMALAGYEQEKRRLEAAMADVQARLAELMPPSTATPEMAPRVRRMSEAARKRIAMVQRKRWAAFREAKAEAKTTIEERKLSAAARKRIAMVQKKRWQAFREAQRIGTTKLPATDQEPVRRFGKPVRKDGKLVFYLR